MWLNDSSKVRRMEESDADSLSSGEEIPIWVRGEQRWVSGISEETTCQDVIQVLLNDEKLRGKGMNSVEKYHITERWRGVEQPLDDFSKILDIWNAWGTAQSEVKISLRRVKHEQRSRRTKCRSDSSNFSDRNVWKTIHPKRLQSLQQPSSTEELLKLVLAQGEVIRRQLKKLRHSEHQIGYLEDKTHRARVRKHGSNYLLETYLKGLSEAVYPDPDDNHIADKNSDSGVITEGDSEQSNNVNVNRTTEFHSPPPPSDASNKEEEHEVEERLELYEKIAKINKLLLAEEEKLTRLEANVKKHEDVGKELTKLRTEMTKSSCEMQHNEIVLEETVEKLEDRRGFLENLYKDLADEDREHEMLQTLLYSKINRKKFFAERTNDIYHTKELLDTLV